MTGLISSSIPNLINGISQQPAALRLPTQAEVQINGASSVVDGLRKRAPTRHVSKFKNSATPGSAYVHTINRDPTERYVTVIENGSIRVFDLAGVEKTVATPNGVGYLALTDPASEVSCVTVADYTFVVNKTKVTNSGASLVPSRPAGGEALVWVKQGAYSHTYHMAVAGVDNYITTPDSTTAGAAAAIATSAIATALLVQLAALGISHGSGGWTIVQSGSVIYLANSGGSFDVSVSDGLGDEAIVVFKGAVQRFSDLPPHGQPGFKIKVGGTDLSAFEDYWVERDGSNWNGTWRESAKPAELKSLDGSTMPHVLVRESDGTFTFREAGWIDRAVGDLDSNPFPSFVGRTINDVFFYRNRLGFLSDENVVLSKAGEFFQFFVDSVLQVQDSDPIDVAVSHTKVSLLRHAVPFNEALLLFSDQTQFMLGQADLLTPKTISINQTTEFEYDQGAKPVGVGKNVYFAQARGAYTGLREYFVSQDTLTNDAVDVTAHCPKYVPAHARKIAVSSSEDIIVVLSKDDPGRLYVYRYYWQNQEKLQSSWSHWEMPAGSTVLNMDFINEDLWLVISRPDGTYLEAVDVGSPTPDAGGAFRAHLDRRVSEAQVTDSYNAGTNLTTITKPWTWQTGEVYQLVAWYGDVTQPWKPGAVVPFTDAGATITVAGKLTKFFLGVRYTFRYRFSTFMVREQSQGGGVQAVGEGRVQVRKATVSFTDTGYFRAEVTPQGRSTYLYPYTGRVGGIVLDTPWIDEGIFTFPVSSKSDQVTVELTSDSPLPCSFLSAGWEAFYSIRSNRL